MSRRPRHRRRFKPWLTIFGFPITPQVWWFHLYQLWPDFKQWWSRYWSVGARGERTAAIYLEKQGYRILGRNCRSRLGEIDLIVESPDQAMLVLVEVKTHQGPSQPGWRPEIRVNMRKQQKLTALGDMLLRRPRYQNRALRFDVIGVDLLPWGRSVIRHHRNAFQATY